MNRREFLKSTVAAAAVMALPAPLLSSPAAVAPATTPMWAVGTPGVYNYAPIAANTMEEAIKFFLEENDHLYEADGSVGCELEAVRVKSWDNIGWPKNADWLRAGMGTHCDRCGYETSYDQCGHDIADEAICEECMTIDDWKIVDPERAAELLEDIQS